MKMKKSDVNILLMVIGLALAAVSYFFVYTKLNEQTDALNAQNATLEQEVNRLQELADNKQQYLDETASMEVAIEEYKKQFPAQYLPEDDILYVVGVEGEHNVWVSNISMAPSQAVEVERPQQESAPIETTEENPEGGAETVVTQEAAPEILLYQTPVAVNMKVEYESIKDIITKINTDTNRKSIESLSLAFDSETGDLNGTMSFSMYSLTGTEATYTTPTVTGITYGTENIFNSAAKKSAIAAEKKAEEAAEADE